MSRHNAAGPRGSKSQRFWTRAALLTTTLAVITAGHDCNAQQKSAASQKKKATTSAGQSVKWSVQPDPAPAAKGPLAAKPVPLECKDTEAKQLLFAGPDAGVAAIVSQADKIFQLERYDLQSGKHLGSVELTNMQHGQELVAVSPDGSRVAHGDNKDRLDVSSASDGSSIAAWRPYGDKKAAEGKLFWAEFLDSDRILTSSQSGRVDLWSLPADKPTWSIEKATLAPFVSSRNHLGVALSPGRRYLTGFNGEGFDLFDTATGELRGKTARVSDLAVNASAKGVAFSPDGKELVAVVDSAGTSGSILARWNLSTGEAISQFRIAIGSDLSLQLRPSLGQRERQWRVQGSPVTSLAWWGPRHVLLSGEYLIDLERQWLVWHFKLHGAGAQAVASPDDRHWFAASKNPGTRAVLTAMPMPADEIQRAVAAAADGKTAALLRPGTKVSLNLEIDGPPTNAESYREKLSEQLVALLASHGLTVADGQDIKLVVRTKVVEGDATFEIRTRGKDGSSGSFRAKRLITQVFWSDKQGKPIWQNDYTVDPGRIGTSMGPEDPATAQLNQQWGNAGSNLAPMFPYFLPQQSAGPTLPGDSVLTPDGIKPAPPMKPLPLLEPPGRVERKAA